MKYLAKRVLSSIKSLVALFASWKLIKLLLKLLRRIIIPLFVVVKWLKTHVIMLVVFYVIYVTSIGKSVTSAVQKLAEFARLKYPRNLIPNVMKEMERKLNAQAPEWRSILEESDEEAENKAILSEIASSLEKTLNMDLERRLETVMKSM